MKMIGVFVAVSVGWLATSASGADLSDMLDRVAAAWGDECIATARA